MRRPNGDSFHLAILVPFELYVEIGFRRVLKSPSDPPLFRRFRAENSLVSGRGGFLRPSQFRQGRRQGAPIAISAGPDGVPIAFSWSTAAA